MGAVIQLLNRQDRVCDRILSDDKGSFSFDGLAAGLYSVRVSLASFMPASKANILVQPGLRTMLNVSLAGLFSSIQLVSPAGGQRSIMSDDWKWVLRTSNATRPVLRLLPGEKPEESAEENRLSGLFSDTRAMVKVSAGDGGRVTSFGNESDLGTAFALATSLLGRNQLQLSGNLGYAPQSGMPSAGFSASYSRAGSDVSSPVVSLTMRQLYLPAGLKASGVTANAPVLRSATLGVKDATQITDALRMEYGFALDSVIYSDRLNFFSPYARFIYSLSDAEQVLFSYNSGIPRSDMFTGSASAEGDLQSDITALALFPRFSALDGHTKVQQAQSFEAGYHRTIGSRTFSAAVFREDISNAALMISSSDGTFPAWGVTPDLFSANSVFNAGGYRSLGYMASASQKLSDNLKVSVMYSAGGALVAERQDGFGANSDDLRSMIHSTRRRAVTSQVTGIAPWTGAKFKASYQWTDQLSVTPAHYYATEDARPEAGLNIFVRQPIPSFSALPIRVEATADLRNLLADGYLPFTLSDGRQFILMHTPRSFRGGLNFIF